MSFCYFPHLSYKIASVIEYTTMMLDYHLRLHRICEVDVVDIATDVAISASEQHEN